MAKTYQSQPNINAFLMLIKHIFPINDISQLNKKVRLFLMYSILDIKWLQWDSIILSFYCPVQYLCNVFIYHTVILRTVISWNPFVWNINIIFNILHFSHGLHNDSKQFFLFVSLYFMRDIHRGEEYISPFSQGSCCRFCCWYKWKGGFEMNREWTSIYLLVVYIYFLVNAWKLMTGSRTL